MFVPSARSRWIAAVLLLLCIALLELPCPAKPEPAEYSAETFEVKATRGHKATMRDGVRLSVDVFQPRAEGKFPAILIITPYSNNPGWQKRATWFAKRGYEVVVADARVR